MIKIIRMYNIDIDTNWAEYLPEMAISANLDIEIDRKRYTVSVCWEYGFAVSSPFLGEDHFLTEEDSDSELKIYVPWLFISERINDFLEENKDSITEDLQKYIDSGISGLEILFNKEVELYG